MTGSRDSILQDHVLNPDHDNLDHPAVFTGSEGSIFCVQCAADRYESAPEFRRLVILDGISCVLNAHGASCLGNSIETCLDILLRGVDSADPSVVQKATENLLVLKGEIPDPVGVLVSLVSRILSIGLPRASGHLFLVGQLLECASQDPVLATTLGRACIGSNDAPVDSKEGGSNACPGDANSIGHFKGFTSFLAAHCVSTSCPAHIKSDLMYVAMELVDCCITAVAAGLEELSAQGLRQNHDQAPFMSSGSDPFVGVMLAIPRLLHQGSASDELLQLHSIAYLAAAVTYCRQRTRQGASGWCSNAAGVPQIFEELLTGCRKNRGDQITSYEAATLGSGTHRSSSEDLCSTLKAMLMAASYRVRSAAARLIESLCGASAYSSTEPKNQAVAFDVDTDEVERFFRESLLKAGATDFLFEAIKTEREGSVRHYLEAAEALALSPVDFFHASNFSIKFAASILLGAMREQESIEGASNNREMLEDRIMSNSDDENAERVFASSSHLLLQALVASPPSSSAGVVEELLATAASRTQETAKNKKNRAIGVAADVLSLIASGNITLPKVCVARKDIRRLLAPRIMGDRKRMVAKDQDRTTFLEAIESLLRHLETGLVAAACGSHPQTGMPMSLSDEQSSLIIPPGDQRVFGDLMGQEDVDGGGGGDLLALNVDRVMESLFLLIAQEWDGSQGDNGSNHLTGKRHRFRSVADDRITSEEPYCLVNLVFRAYERTLPYLHALAARSEDFANVIAFVSCVGVAADAASAVLHKRLSRMSSDCNDGRRALRVRPSFVGESEPTEPFQGGHDPRSVQGSVHFFKEMKADDGDYSDDQPSAEKRVFLESADRPNPATSAASSCLETVLRTAVQGNVISWILALYARCSDEVLQNSEGSKLGILNADSTDPYRMPKRSVDADAECCATAREVLGEVLESLLFAQGWVNGLYAGVHGKCLLLTRKSVAEDGQGDGRSKGVIRGAMTPRGDALGSVLRSWRNSCGNGGETVTLDHHALSLLGTSADNGNACKLVVLLISLSPSYLGMLHPHPGCRVESAAKLLRFVKTVPETVFSLNMFSYAISSCVAERSARSSQLPPALAAAVRGVLARFPVTEIAASSIPLSSMALSLSTQAGCTQFVADWLVACPLVRIKRAMRGLGLPDEQQHTEEAPDVMQWSNGEVGGEDACLTATSREECDERTLTSVLECIVDRWSAELTNGLQHSRAETTILRLSSVLLLSPDTFFGLAFVPRAPHFEDGPDNQHGVRSTTAQSLGVVIGDTLGEISRALSSVVLRKSEGEDSKCDRASKLLCAFQVLQLASAFLHADCIHGLYASLAHGHESAAVAWALQSRRPPLELEFAGACGGLMRFLFDPYQFHRRTEQDGICKYGSRDSVLLCTLNLFSALIILMGGGVDLPPKRKQEWRSSFEGARGAFDDVLSSREITVGMLGNWYDHSPDLLASFLQACVIWNEVVSSRVANISADTRLDPPFEVLFEVLRLGHRGPCDTGTTGGRTGTPLRERQLYMRNKEKHLLLQLFAARCIESMAPTKPFSGQEVQALQLLLQDTACTDVAVLTSAALRAIRALWEANSGLFHPNELVGQSWNSFVIESSFQTALRLLMTRKENDIAVDGRSSIGEADCCADFCFGEDLTQRFEIDAAMVLSSVGRLVRWSVGKRFQRLRASIVPDSRSVEVLSERALLCMHRCVVFLAKNLRMTLQAWKGDVSRGAEDCADERHTEARVQALHGVDCEVENYVHLLILHLSDALAQLLCVMKCMGTPLSGETRIPEALRKEVVDALSQVKPSFVLSQGNKTLPQAVMPFTGMNCHSTCVEGFRSSRYDEIFYVEYDQWWLLSRAPSACINDHDLAGEIQEVIEFFTSSIMPVGRP